MKEEEKTEEKGKKEIRVEGKRSISRRGVKWKTWKRKNGTIIIIRSRRISKTESVK